MLFRTRGEEQPEFWVTQKSNFILAVLTILSLCSFIATLWGTIELIQAGFFEGRSLLSPKLADIIVLAVAVGVFGVIQLALIFSVKTCYSRRAPILRRCIAAVVYLFCVLITAGFGFGFWWKVVAASKETFESTRASVELVDSELSRAAESLRELKFKVDGLKAYSTEKATEERTRGNTCGASQAAPGPRQRLRNADAAKFDSLGNYIGQKLAAVDQNIDIFQKQFEKVRTNDPSTLDRTGSNGAFIENLSYRLSFAVASFNDLTNDPILKSFREDLNLRAGQTDFAEGTARFSCPDSQLSSEINGTVAAIDRLLATKVTFRKINVTEGAQAVVHAFGRLKNTALAAIVNCHLIIDRSCALPPSASEIREHINSGDTSFDWKEEQAGLGRDDMLPLALGVIVDVLILGFGYFRFRAGQIPAHAEKFVARIDSCFRQVFDRSPTPAERLLPIKAAVFDRWSGHYAAVPVDFRNYKSVSERVHKAPRWAQKDSPELGEDEEDEVRLPTMHEAQYLDNVFTALKQAGFVKLLSIWGRLSNFITENSAREYLDRQNSFFANAPSLRIYKFYPDAYAIMLDHFFSVESGGQAPVKGTGIDRGGRVRNPDHFPSGYGHDL